MSDDENDHRTWSVRLRTWLGTTIKKATLPGVTGFFAIGFFIATAFAAWQHPTSGFGKFSLSLGIAIASVAVGVWGADYYHRKDAYKKRFRDVEVSVYTTWLLITGVEVINQHIINARANVLGLKPASEDEHAHKLIAHGQLEAGHTAAELTISMSYMALANLETFSKDAVESVKKKFASNEQEAGVRQQVRAGKQKAPADVPPKSSAAVGDGEVHNG